GVLKSSPARRPNDNRHRLDTRPSWLASFRALTPQCFGVTMKLRREGSGMIKVSPAVFEGLEAVRRSGRTNMLDWQAVRRIAGELGYAETSRWIENHREHY